MLNFNFNIRSASGTSKAFEPEPIIDSEERERLGQLAQRDFLVRSYGLVEQVDYPYHI